MNTSRTLVSQTEMYPFVSFYRVRLVRATSEFQETFSYVFGLQLVQDTLLKKDKLSRPDPKI